MKKLLILWCLLPTAGFAQTIIKYVSLPQLGVDSISKLRTLRVVAPVAGANKDKLTLVMNKWLASNYTATTNAVTAPGATALNGEGLFLGSIAVARPQHDPSSTDRLNTNMAPVDYKVKFTIKVFVTDEKYAIVLNNLKLEFYNVNTPVEPYYEGNYPSVEIPDENRGMDVGEMYVRMFKDINFNLQDVAKSASKYIAKAKKKGDL
jgi:hypothetical protein